MNDASYPQDGAAAEPATDEPEPATEPQVSRAPIHQIVLALVRSVVSLLLVVWIYLQWDPRFSDSTGVIYMVIGLVLFMGWVAWQGQRIVHARYPGLRAVETLATVIPLFLVVFAGTYYSLSVENSAAFNEVLDKGSAAYFTIVVLSTTGFGDIVPRTGWARAAVNVQMLIDLFFVALVLRFILGAVGRGRERRMQGIPPKPALPRRERPPRSTS